MIYLRIIVLDLMCSQQGGDLFLPTILLECPTGRLTLICGDNVTNNKLSHALTTEGHMMILPLRRLMIRNDEMCQGSP